MIESFGAGVLGALAGAVATWYAAQRDKRFETAFELHNEFFSAEMLKARGVADHYLMTKQGVHFRELHYSHRDPEMDSVFMVMEFYERVALAHKHKRLSAALATDLFASIYLYWWKNYFEVGTKESKWEVGDRLLDLKNVFKKQLGSARFAEYERRAIEELENNRQASKPNKS